MIISDRIRNRKSLVNNLENPRSVDPRFIGQRHRKICSSVTGEEQRQIGGRSSQYPRNELAAVGR